MKKQRKKDISKTAVSQIRELFRHAEDAESALAKRYVDIALKISTRTKTPLPRELKRRFCRNCHAFFVPGRNCRIRVSKGKIVYYCLECRHFRRFVYS